jgi:molecular chaperone DnaJ
MRDPYEVLGVPKTATDDEIKKAYRKLAREFHPDRNPGDESAEERFKEVQGAYDLLADPEKRQQFDRFGQNGPGGAGAGGFGPGQGGWQNVDLGDLGDILGQFGGIFGRGAGRRQQPRPERGHDLEVGVRISFEEALEGVQVRVPVEIETACHVCAGTGAEPGTAPRACPECNGSGVVSDSHGLFALSQPCPRCRGNGVVVDTPCTNCRGTGRERVTKRYAVKIPAGAKDGTRVRLKGKGEPGRGGGPSGDLFVRVEVEASELYERRGADLVLDVPVTYPEAALGATVQIPTPGGTVALKVPAGTESGKLLRVKGRGAPRLKGGGRGDLLARVKVTVPKKLSKAEKEALEEYRKASREQPRDRFEQVSA